MDKQTSAGAGAAPVAGWDVIAGSVIVEVVAGVQAFSVRHGVEQETYPLWESTAPPAYAGPPIGIIDTPANMSIVAGEVAVTGWAIDNTGVLNVEIWRSPVTGETASPNGMVFLGNASMIEGARPDVVAQFSLYPGVSRAGWGFMVLTNFLPNGGNGTFVLHAVARTSSGEARVIGSKTIVGVNSTNQFPLERSILPAKVQPSRVWSRISVGL